jgi:hypothetical protein
VVRMRAREKETPQKWQTTYYFVVTSALRNGGEGGGMDMPQSNLR